MSKYKKKINDYMTLLSNDINASEGEILIYGDIVNQAYFDGEISPTVVRDSLAEMGIVNVLNIHVNSYGGSVPDGNAIIAILDDYRRKHGTTINAYIEGIAASMGSGIPMIKVPYQFNDVLYVRETWGYGYYDGEYIYKASDKLADLPNFQDSAKMLYRPSINMPKEAARIFLRVKDVQVERLKDIAYGWRFDEEGIILHHGMISEAWRDYANLWNSTIKKADLDKYGWNANPWVWVIEFERISKEEALASENG